MYHLGTKKNVGGERKGGSGIAKRRHMDLQLIATNLALRVDIFHVLTVAAILIIPVPELFRMLSALGRSAATPLEERTHPIFPRAHFIVYN